MSWRPLVLMLLFLVSFGMYAERAHAQRVGAAMVVLPVDAEMQANFDRATAYWNAPAPCDKILISVDQEYVVPNAAMAGGCIIWIGDYYLSRSPGRQCQIIVHEWGHLTGHRDGSGLLDDPLNVMGSNAMPPSCAGLDPAPVSVAPTPTPVPSPTAAPGRSQAEIDAYVRWATQRAHRTDCTVSANMKRHRAARVAARRRCVQRYGRIGAAPLPTKTAGL